MTRYLHSRLTSRQLPDLLQTILVAELIAPSQCLWLVSPWISDIPIIDNTANTFLSLEPAWYRSKIRFSQVLATLTQQGTTVCIATRYDLHNNSFLETLKAKADSNYLNLHRAEELHTKGILSDSFFLSGSMNFTFNGITVNQEMLSYETDLATIAEQKINFRERWGGVVL
ncbi:phospholipase D-like domain-containing protein DpdK [Leptolyngbya sp. GGD]|uniref:phospholipase D-like domain-containing protein DpdK n=1 Tax=Leptolyngbya sp. GGD TaxID=2997907 RepID=UPI00227BF23A|nr:phospholipase D-like domain-containing protein DpdK [Leptolyngbya sp. GGD]MCY6493406.1 phospholipase D-like domain-containing protein DpdK [Leptolyngbya sp. GGD]